LHIQIAKLRWKVIGTEKAETHRCAICGLLGAWGPAWTWYGSTEDLNCDAPILKTCGVACRKEAVRRGLAPEGAAIDGDGS
jgi:hypothetical protein